MKRKIRCRKNVFMPGAFKQINLKEEALPWLRILTFEQRISKYKIIVGFYVFKFNVINCHCPEQHLLRSRIPDVKSY